MLTLSEKIVIVKLYYKSGDSPPETLRHRKSIRMGKGLITGTAVKSSSYLLERHLSVIFVNFLWLQ